MKQDLTNTTGRTLAQAGLLSEADLAWAAQVQKKIEGKMPDVRKRNLHKIPYTTGPDGLYDDRSDEKVFADSEGGIGWWTNGFYGGLLRQMYAATGDPRYAQAADIQEEKLDRALEVFDGLHHDVGFMYLPTAGANYLLNGGERSRARFLHAATLLAGRFNPAGRFIRAWNEAPDNDLRGWAIIDCLMNLSILYRASEATKDPRFAQIAAAHARTATENFVREDGSVCHIVVFDPVSGERLTDLGGQGYEQGSAWTRGQAWGIYGFTNSYRHTGERRFLAAAQRVADYFISQVPESGVIPIDFKAPEELRGQTEDACGAAVAACGLLVLASELVKEPTARDIGRAAVYTGTALKLLRAIDGKADYRTETDAMVQECSGSWHGGDHHMTMVYADYYYTEAILALTGKGLLFW